MTARDKDAALAYRLSRAGINASEAQARTLRRAEMTLQRWAEAECGDSNACASWSIERDEATGKPYRCFYPHAGEPSKHPIPDRQRGALARVQAVCAELGAHYYHQTDPRGCALYVDAKPIDSRDYTRAVAVY